MGEILHANGIDLGTLPDDVVIQAVRDRCANGKSDGPTLARELARRLEAADAEIAELKKLVRYAWSIITDYIEPSLVRDSAEKQAIEAIMREGESHDSKNEA